MIEHSSEYNGFRIEFHCAGARSKEMHSFLSSRAAHGSDIQQRIRDTLNSAAQVIADEIAKEPHIERPDLGNWKPTAEKVEA